MIAELAWHMTLWKAAFSQEETNNWSEQEKQEMFKKLLKSTYRRNGKQRLQTLLKSVCWHLISIEQKTMITPPFLPLVTIALIWKFITNKVLSLHIQSECEKMRTKITPNTETFHAVLLKCFYYLYHLLPNVTRRSLLLLIFQLIVPRCDSSLFVIRLTLSFTVQLVVNHCCLLLLSSFKQKGRAE